MNIRDPEQAKEAFPRTSAPDCAPEPIIPHFNPSRDEPPLLDRLSNLNRRMQNLIANLRGGGIPKNFEASEVPEDLGKLNYYNQMLELRAANICELEVSVSVLEDMFE